MSLRLRGGGDDARQAFLQRVKRVRSDSPNQYETQPEASEPTEPVRLVVNVLPRDGAEAVAQVVVKHAMEVAENRFQSELFRRIEALQLDNEMLRRERDQARQRSIRTLLDYSLKLH